ncbi:hypothetical protein EJ04DRAFT_562073 [Polyplosphaeria fusca]|uniref:2EXR domain-containing protein n=1 Tax=Polyplosphaeria fusca TaxID=682080 RepID=A0A9P4V3K9_9PLEO|nr:hypothetical protein EJ04DRAFT_562073 [Polyplosphaeria fusca]
MASTPDPVTTLTTFPLFPLLPHLIRLRIWILASPSPRTHFLELYAHSKTAYTHRVRVRYIPPLDPLFSACTDSRNAIGILQGGRIISLNTRPRRTHMYFNHDHDILFLSSRFKDGMVTSETQRLRGLEGVMGCADLRHVRRVVVTYSGVDDYASVALAMRWLKGLETLYVGMVDWWSERGVRRRVRRGSPRMGEVEGVIGRRLGELEGEETSDEEEEEEGGECRGCGEKRSVRVVEVELRLEEGVGRMLE